MLSKSNIEQLNKQGKKIEKVEAQIQNFIDGFPFMKVDRPATVKDGILKLSEEDMQNAISYYEDIIGKYTIIKFVPASGAASRMFKDLFSFLEEANKDKDAAVKLKNGQDYRSVAYFFDHIEKFAFYNDLKEVLKKDGLDIYGVINSDQPQIILEYLLTDKGLNYGSLPKGLLKFHRYEESARTPVEEHLVEAALYGRSNPEEAFIHFTVSPEHESKFRAHIDQVVNDYRKKNNIDFNISFSTQKPETDTIAVDLNNDPFVLEDGNILFRPAGHGALIENLNDLDGDIVFIKNIDNVVPDHLKDETVKFKKALAGKLIEYQERIFYYLHILEEEDTYSPSFMEEVEKFIQEELCEELMPGKDILDAKAYFINKLNRPIRICGMVKNEGEPGGGPFWAKNPDNTISLQIVESAQVDESDEGQLEIARSATHFNPVDLICGIKNFKGERFDLTGYIDPETGFISRKSQGGRELKALELPGLWNGSMSDWISIFVEVPIATFNPVKVVNDLLRNQHQ
jgi:hypothetical protein